MKTRRRKSGGFTLVEILISMVVLGLGLLAMVLGNTYVQQASEKNHERMVAAQDAHRVLELIRDASVNGNFPANVTAAFPTGAVAGFNNLPGEQVAASYANTNQDPLDITVTTTWLERGRRNTSIQLRTLMTQRTNP